MKRLVNGQEAELETSLSGVEVIDLGDRLMVRTPEGARSAVAVRDGDSVLVSYLGRQFRIERTTARGKSAAAHHSGEMKAPMPGQVVDVLVEEGAAVKKGDKLLVVEAMKVQQAYTAPFDGKVAKLPVTKGQQVNEGALLVLVEQE